jgi:hydrogenase nickel incorporation protein HypB
MCSECGCSEDRSKKTLEPSARILEMNDRQAQKNREHFDRHGVLAVNLMSSPGSGKTSLLEKTAELAGEDLKIGVIEGDLETSRDADRLRSKGIPAFQITTGQTCHLDARMVHEAVHHLPLDALDVVFIENVGNLVCPASYDVGAHLNVVLLSVTEGDDKPEKYPLAFRSADLMVITKVDLLPYVDFDPDRAVNLARSLNPSLHVIKLSSRTGEGLDLWIDYLKSRLKAGLSS